MNEKEPLTHIDAEELRRAKPMNGTRTYGNNNASLEPMSEQNELTDEIRDIARSMITCSHYGDLPDWKFDIYLREILTKVKQRYPIRYKEYADLVGWLLDKGWIPPGEQKRLDRPELREKIARILEKIDEPYGEEWDKIEYTPYKDMYLKRTDQLLALLIPDIEEAKKPLLEEIKHLEGIIESLSNR